MFLLSQKGNEVLLLKIADFLKRTIVQNSTILKESIELELLEYNTHGTSKNRVNVYPEGKLDFFVLNTINIYFIKLALIPLLDDLT